MTKVVQIRSAIRSVSAHEAMRLLEGIFAPFDSLKPVAEAVASAMVAVVDGDRSALGRLAETLESVECNQICNFEFGWTQVTIVTSTRTRTSGTRITLVRNSGCYDLIVDFPDGSNHKAEQARAAFEAAGVEYRQRTT